MSRANFSPIPAKPTFGTKQYNFYASDYILNKKIKSQFCNSYKSYSFNNPINYQIDFTESNLLLLNKYRYPKKKYNTANLNINLYTSLNLKNVNVVEQTNPVITPTTINPSEIPFYENYTIDASGVLFGNSECGINNYVNFQLP